MSPAKAYWLFSTEPADYSWQMCEKEKRVTWDGIRGAPARKWMREIKKGDGILGYHSSPEKQLVCVAQAAGPARPDPTDEDWLVIDILFKRWLKKPVPLATLRTRAVLKEMRFSRMPRLSVSPVRAAELKVLSKLSETNLV